MLLEPGERTTTEAEVAEELRAIAARPNSVLLADDVGEPGCWSTTRLVDEQWMAKLLDATVDA